MQPEFGPVRPAPLLVIKDRDGQTVEVFEVENFGFVIPADPVIFSVKIERDIIIIFNFGFRLHSWQFVNVIHVEDFSLIILSNAVASGAMAGFIHATTAAPTEAHAVSGPNGPRRDFS